MSAVIMIVSAAAIILFVKYGLLKGIHQIASAMRWSAKARGQVTGYATSVPELVCLVAAGLAGVWEVGLWNIASSNIINGGLMLTAVLVYRQFGDLKNPRFADEVGFATAAILVPIVLMEIGLDSQWYLVPVLIVFFVLYRAVDTRLSPQTVDRLPAEETVGSLPLGLMLSVSALVAVAVAGAFLGGATAAVVEQLGIHPALAGWILGTVTSIPEMVTFFAVYATAKREGTLDDFHDTQEVLDNLTSSNMANVGLVYPFGLLAYLLAAWILAGG